VPQARGERRPQKMTPTKKTSNEILTVEEVAEFLKVHASTIYKLLKRREIPAFRVGTDWRFHAVQIEEWVKSRTRAHEDEG
jgi:excisionase family DNA binding protein